MPIRLKQPVHYGGYSYGHPDQVGSDYHWTACGLRGEWRRDCGYTKKIEMVTCSLCLRVRVEKGQAMIRDARKRMAELGVM